MSYHPPMEKPEASIEDTQIDRRSRGNTASTFPLCRIAATLPTLGSQTYQAHLLYAITATLGPQTPYEGGIPKDVPDKQNQVARVAGLRTMRRSCGG
jgi:hypothetical protein